MKFKEQLKTAGICFLLILAVPFLLAFLIFKLIWSPVTYIKYKHSRYQQDFPCRFSWLWDKHIDSEAYAVIKENDLPVAYIKHCGEYGRGGFFVYKDALLCFSEPVIHDAQKGILYSWIESDKDTDLSENDEENADDDLNVDAVAACMLQDLQNERTEHTCGRVVFFFSRQSVEAGYTEGSLEKMRRVDDFVIYEKGGLAKTIRAFIENCG